LLAGALFNQLILLLFLDMNFDFDYKKFSFDHSYYKGITTLFDQKRYKGHQGTLPAELVVVTELSEI